MSKNVPKFETAKQTRFKQPILPIKDTAEITALQTEIRISRPKLHKHLHTDVRKWEQELPNLTTERRCGPSCPQKIPDTSHRLSSTVRSTQIQTNYMPSQYTKPEEGFCMKKSCVRLKDFGSTNACRRHQNQFLISDTK